jgi:hypothetical protein
MIKRIDFIFNKVLPKKLVVWIVATILVWNKLIPGDLWCYITMIYLGVNVAQKFSILDKKFTGEGTNEDK